MTKDEVTALFNLAMEVTTVEAAEIVLAKLVAADIDKNNCGYLETTIRIKNHLAFYSHYLGNITRARVESLFDCAHPVFGSIRLNGGPTREDVDMLMRMWSSKTLKPIPRKF